MAVAATTTVSGWVKATTGRLIGLAVHRLSAGWLCAGLVLAAVPALAADSQDPRAFGVSPRGGIDCSVYAFPYTLVGADNTALVTNLREAIECANANGTADVIDLGGQTITLADAFADYSGATGLPQITSNVTLRNGNLTRSGSTLFRILSTGAAGNLSLRTVTVSNGGGAGFASLGAGLHNLGTTQVIGSHIRNNTANRAVAIYSTGTLVVANSTIAGNSASTYTAILEMSGTATIANSVISGNRSTTSDNIWINSGTLTMSNSTVAYNYTAVSASNTSGAFYVFPAGALAVRNSIVWGNRNANNSADQIEGNVTPTVSNSIIERGIFGGLNSDPLFVTPIAVLSTPTTAGDFQLSNFSPAIDAGANANVVADNLDVNGNGITNEDAPDLAGNPRRYNDTVVTDTGVGTAPIVDMGAYEKQTNSVPSLSIDDVTLNEGNAGTTSFTFTVSLSAPAPAGGVSFSIATADGTAQDDIPSSEDFDYVSRALNAQTIAEGTSTYTLTVLGLTDTKVEPSETFFVNLSNVIGATLGDGQGLGTLLNDDSATLTIANITQAESGTFTFSAVLSAATATPFSVDWTFAPGNTVAADYVGGVLPTGGTLNFTGNAGETQTFTIPVLDDTLVEPTETFTVGLANFITAGGFTVNISDTATGTITDDDVPSASITVAPASVDEDGAATLDYTVTLSQASAVTISVNFSVSGSATSGTDFAAVTSPLTFVPGQTVRQTSAAPTVDAVAEADETVILTLAAGTGYTVGAPASATGTILNDDLPTTTVVSLDRASGNPRNAPTATWTILFADPVSGLTPANFALLQTGLGGTPMITSVSEASGPPSTQWNITATTGTGTGTLAVSLVNDTGLTHDVTNVPFAGQVFDIDRTPPTVTITVADTDLRAGETSAVSFVFSESVDAIPAANVSVENGNLSTPTSVDNITWSATLTPTAGIVDATNVISLDVTGTRDAAGNAGVGITPSNNYAIDTLARTLSIDDVARNEGFNGVGGVDFTVTLSAPAPVGGVSFDIATADGTATAGSDYVARNFTSRIIAEGATTYTLAVPVNGDAMVETDETYVVNLGNPVGASIADGQGQGTILNDDTAGVSIVQSGGTTTATEGGATDSYTVVLTSQPSANVAVALSGTQMSATPTPLIFTTANWNVAQTVTVTAIDDAVAEGNHSGSVTSVVMSSDTDYSGLVVAPVGVTIIDNDSAGVSIAPTTISVNEGGTGSYGVVLTTQPTSSVTIVVSADAQVTASPTTLTFSTINWNVAQTVVVTAVDDSVIEAAQVATITHAASGGDYAGVAIASVTVDIVDNDFSIGGTVSGLSGNGLVLQNNGSDALAILANGSFTFPVALNDGNSYAVSIQTQPSGQVCVVDNASGTLSGANVGTVAVSCGAIALGVSASQLELGDVVAGDTTTAQLVVTNVGSGHLMLAVITQPAAPFTIAGGSCLALPVTLAPGAQCTLDIAFAPTSLGTFSGSLLITSNAASSPTVVTMSGTVIAGSNVAPTAIPASNPLGLLLLALALMAMAWTQLGAARHGSH